MLLTKDAGPNVKVSLGGRPDYLVAIFEKDYRLSIFQNKGLYNNES